MDPVTLEGKFTTRSQNAGQQAPSSGVQYVFRKNEDLNGTALKAWKLVQTRLITCAEVTVFAVTNIEYTVLDSSVIEIKTFLLI
jgi:hypothetical protein